MSKQLNYLMVAEQLTGDSRVMFFTTPELAKQGFDNITQPLIKIWADMGCNPHYDDDDVFYSVKDGKGIRFNSGQLEELDELIGHTNVYYEWGTVDVADDVTHYVAQFSEWVDESDIDFYTKDTAVIRHNSLIDEGLQIAEDHHGYIIDRNDQSTWENAERGTLFSEDVHTSPNHIDTFFGYSDVYYTIRRGEIKIEEGAQ